MLGYCMLSLPCDLRLCGYANTVVFNRQQRDELDEKSRLTWPRALCDLFILNVNVEIKAPYNSLLCDHLF